MLIGTGGLASILLFFVFFFLDFFFMAQKLALQLGPWWLLASPPCVDRTAVFGCVGEAVQKQNLGEAGSAICFDWLTARLVPALID